MWHKIKIYLIYCEKDNRFKSDNYHNVKHMILDLYKYLLRILNIDKE